MKGERESKGTVKQRWTTLIKDAETSEKKRQRGVEGWMLEKNRGRRGGEGEGTDRE